MLMNRYFIPNLHLTLLSSSGSPLTALVLAARAAFMDLRIPSTKRIGWEESETISYDGMKDSDLSGIKSAVKAGRIGGKGKGKAAVKGDEWDLDLTTAGGRGVEWMAGRENLPVLVTLHLVRLLQSYISHAKTFRYPRVKWYSSMQSVKRNQPVQIEYTVSLPAKGNYVV